MRLPRFFNTPRIMLQKAEPTNKDTNDNKLLREYETLLKNIILSERILKQIRSKEKEISLVSVNKPSTNKDQIRNALSKRGCKSNTQSRTCSQMDQVTKSSSKPRCSNVINRKLTRSFENRPDVESLDSVTALATTLLQDDLVPIAEQYNNNHNCLFPQQTDSLSELLPRLRNMVILTGNDELIHLVQHAQTAARRILQSYGSFVNSALSLTKDVPPEAPVSETGPNQTAYCTQFNCTNQGTQVFSRKTQNCLNKVDASTMTQSQDSSIQTTRDQSVATTEICFPQAETNEALLSNQVYRVPTAPSTLIGTSQNIPSNLTSFGNGNRFHSPSRDKQGLIFQNYKTHVVQLKRQLALEQEQVRNLSAQLYQCQRDLEKSRLDCLQREAQLKADLRVFQNREVQLVKSNTELSNELHLAEYHINQLQFRLSLLNQLPHKTQTTVSYNTAGIPFDSDRTFKSCVPEQKGPHGLDSAFISEDPPPSDMRLLDRAHPHSAFERSSLQEKESQRVKRPNTVSSPVRDPQFLSGSESSQTPNESMRLDRFPSTRSATKSRLYTGVHKKDSWDTRNGHVSTVDNIDDQSIASVTSRSSEDPSSLHSVDEQEFRKSLAQLDERINCMRQALHTGNPIITD